jgi:hypothetical protein
MSFRDFEQTIASSELRHVARHWNDRRGSRKLPGWSDIQPSLIAAQLPIIWSYKYDRVSDSFIGRLAGDKIERMFGKSFRGSPMNEIYPKEDFPILFARSKRVVCEPALFRGEGMVFKHIDRLGRGERIILPLADDGVAGDGLLGVTQYQLVDGVPSADDSERESWFPL